MPVIRRALSGLAALLLVASSACVPRRATTSPPTKLEPTVAAPTPAGDPELGERLARLGQRLEAARVEHHVPGMAVAVVRDDRVIFAKGFGLADVAGERPVTRDTVFAIGSSTKAFTSALVGTFVDQGALSWDDAIAARVPELELAVRGTDAKPTLRDALCHRTGFTRMGPLWAGGGVSRTVMFQTATKAEPWADYGKTFLYNNVVYASAGEAAARVGGKSWDALIQARIFDPLRMTASSTSAMVAGGDPRRAQGYRYDDAIDAFEPVPMRNLDLIGPAGAINSTVVDMAQWLRFQLGRGAIDGQRILSEARIEDTWTPQIDVGGGVRYGLGWFVRDWKGHRVIEHGGNIDGYAATVAFMPDDGLGFVLLSNVSGSMLQSTSLPIVWESLLEPLEPPVDAAPAVDPSPYVGKYVANFGPWDDARFTVTAEGSELFLDVPMQTKYALLPPDDGGKWRFADAPQIAVSFEMGPEGAANLLRLHQGGADFEMPRQGWTPAVEIDLQAHLGYLGTFASQDGKLRATVLVRGNRLAVDIPGQMVYELHKPDADGKWRFRIKDDIAVSFETPTPKRGKKRDSKPKPVAVVLHQGGVATRMARVADGPKLPTLTELAQLRKEDKREKAIASLGLLEATGTIRLVQSGVEGSIRVVFDATRSRTEVDLGPFGTIVDVDNGTRAWTEGSLSPVTELHGKYLAQSRQSHPLAWSRALSKTFTSVDVVGGVEVQGAWRLRVTLRQDDLPATEAVLDAKTGDVLSAQGSRLVPLAGGVPVRSQLSDYRAVMGLRLAHVLESEDTHSGRTVVTWTKVGPSSADPGVVFPSAPPGPPSSPL